LVGQNFPGRHVVPIGETSWNHQDLVTLEIPGLFPQPIDVDPVGNCTRLLEGK
jgi:hypothetical protein